MTLHPLIARLLDGDIELADLPAELRSEGERAIRALRALDRTPLALSQALEARVMAAVRQRAASPARGWWRWLTQPRELRVRVRPWLLAPVLAAAAVAFLLILPSGAPRESATDVATVDSALVRFVFHAPAAHAVTIAGSFNDWSLEAAPLARGDSGVWTITLTLPAGQHQYAFVVDGRKWVADPAAPAVDDGLGHRNSVMAVAAAGERIL